MKSKIKLGSTVKDKITGFTGTATGYAKYITGCDQYGITPDASADNKYPETTWLDENRIEVVKKPLKKVSTSKYKGCDTPHPTKK